MTLFSVLGVVLLSQVAALVAVAGFLWLRRTEWRRPVDDVAEPHPTPRPVPAVDPRPLPAASTTFATDEAHRGEAWLAVGALPVNARQLALVMAKLPVGTQFAGIEPDAVNGDGAMKLGFTHWSFAAPNQQKFPNGPRLWVSWASEDEPIVSWPTVGE